MKYDIIIVGAGIAGMTAAIYACRAGKKVAILEGKICGGMAMQTETIRNYPGFAEISGKDLTEKIYHQTNIFGATFLDEEVENVEKVKEGFVVKTDEDEHEARAIVLAVGTTERKMGLAREAEMINRGVSYCATCDGALYKGKNVAIVGGGNSALYSALYLMNLAKKIYLVHRREEFRGEQILVEELQKQKNVEFVLKMEPKDILGKERVERLKVQNVKDGSERVLQVEGIFVAEGKVPATEKFKDLVKCDAQGYIVAGEDCRTSCSKIFAAGDCRQKNLRQLITAAADGANAANEAIRDLK